MYRHLLVPLDDSPLSFDTVRKAVVFARTLGAKVTFLHAQDDYESSSLGALERVISPAAFNETPGRRGARDAVEGRGRRTRGRRRPRLGRGDEQPAPRGDSRHGRTARLRPDLHRLARPPRLKGLVLGSQTQKVLQHTTIPVLVSAVESNLPADQPIRPLRHDRRRAPLARSGDPRPRVPRPRSARQGTAAVVRAAARDAPLHQASFPRRCTIRRRTRTCSRKLRERTTAFDETLDELERQHVAGRQLVERLEDSIVALRGGSRPRLRRVCRSGRALRDRRQMDAHEARDRR